MHIQLKLVIYHGQRCCIRLGHLCSSLTSWSLSAADILLHMALANVPVQSISPTTGQPSTLSCPGGTSTSHLLGQLCSRDALRLSRREGSAYIHQICSLTLHCTERSLRGVLHYICSNLRCTPGLKVSRARGVTNHDTSAQAMTPLAPRPTGADDT